MKIWEDDNQKYIKAMMEKNTTEQNEKLTKRLEEIDFSVLEHIERKETVNERGVFAPLDAVEVSEIEARVAGTWIYIPWKRIWSQNCLRQCTDIGWVKLCGAGVSDGCASDRTAGIRAYLCDRTAGIFRGNSV